VQSHGESLHGIDMLFLYFSKTPYVPLGGLFCIAFVSYFSDIMLWLRVDNRYELTLVRLGDTYGLVLGTNSMATVAAA